MISAVAIAHQPEPTTARVAQAKLAGKLRDLKSEVDSIETRVPPPVTR